MPDLFGVLYKSSHSKTAQMHNYTSKITIQSDNFNENLLGRSNIICKYQKHSRFLLIRLHTKH